MTSVRPSGDTAAAIDVPSLSAIRTSRDGALPQRPLTPATTATAATSQAACEPPPLAAARVCISAVIQGLMF